MDILDPLATDPTHHHREIADLALAADSKAFNVPEQDVLPEELADRGVPRSLTNPEDGNSGGCGDIIDVVFVVVRLGVDPAGLRLSLVNRYGFG